MKRANFALLWALTLHDKNSSDDAFPKCLPYVEHGGIDECNFVKKSVNMALRNRNSKFRAACRGGYRGWSLGRFNKSRSAMGRKDDAPRT